MQLLDSLPVAAGEFVVEELRDDLCFSNECGAHDDDSVLLFYDCTSSTLINGKEFQLVSR